MLLYRLIDSSNEATVMKKRERQSLCQIVNDNNDRVWQRVPTIDRTSAMTEGIRNGCGQEEGVAGRNIGAIAVSLSQTAFLPFTI